MAYKSATKSYAHQKEASRRLKDKKLFALLMAMRTGKTKVILDDFGRLEDEDKAIDLLVIAPAGAYRTWEGEIETHVAPSLRRRLSTYLWAASNNTKIEQRKLRLFLDGLNGPRALIVNTEAFSEVERLRALTQEYLSTKRPTYVALDESTMIKGEDSKRSRYICDKVRPLADYRRIMSGLPAPNSPLDLWAQFYFLDPAILGDSYVNYRAEYAEVEYITMLPLHVLQEKLLRRIYPRTSVMRGIEISVFDLTRNALVEEIEKAKIWIQKIPIIKKFKNEDVLAKIINPHSYRVRLDECYDMPEKVYARRYVEMTKEQARVYREIREFSTAELASKDHVTVNMVITKMLRLHQVLCGHVKDEEGKLHSIPDRRGAEILNVLAEYDGKAIIWCAYDYNIHQLSELIGKEYGHNSIARFWGGNLKTRETEERRFKTDLACRFMLATPAAGGRGRTWSNANLMIYHSNTNNLEHRAQSEERAEAVGKQSPLLVIDIECPGTVDTHFIDCLRRKYDMARIIVGDEWRKWI